MFRQNFLKDLTYALLYRKEAQRIIVEVEEIAESVGFPIHRALEEALKNLKKRNPLVEEALYLLKKGKPRNVAYQKIFSKDLLLFLSISEEKSLPVVKVFKEYNQTKKRVEEIKSEVKKVIFGNFFMNLLFIFGAFFFVKKITSIQIEGVDLSVFLLYWKFLFLIPALYALGFFFPFSDRINPLLRSFNKDFKALALLSVFRISESIGLQTSRLIEIYEKMGGEFKKIASAIPHHKRNVEGVVLILSSFLSPLEKGLLVFSAKQGQVESFLRAITEKKILALKEKGMVFKSSLGLIGKIINTVPILYIVLVYLKFMSAIVGSARLQ